MAMSKWIFPTMPALVCPAGDQLLPRATGSPSAARPRHDRSTQQPSVTPAKERASPTNSTSEDFFKLGVKQPLSGIRFRGSEAIITVLFLLFWVSGRAVDSGGQKLGFKSPALCFFFFSSESPGLSFSGVQASPTVNFFLFACFCMDFCMTYFIFLFFLLQV